MPELWRKICQLPLATPYIHLLVGIGNFVDAALYVILLLCFCLLLTLRPSQSYDLLSNIAVRHLTQY